MNLGESVDLIPSRFAWQIKNILKRQERATLTVVESSTPSTPSPQGVPAKFMRLENSHPMSGRRLFESNRGDVSVDSNVSFNKGDRFPVQSISVGSINNNVMASPSIPPPALVDASKPSPLQLYLDTKQNEVESLRKSVNEAEEKYNGSVEKFRRKDHTDYRKQCCGPCHFRPSLPSERCHSRTNCPNKTFPCTTAASCGDIEKHPHEKDIVRQLKANLESAKRLLRDAEQTCEMREKFLVKTLDQQLRERLLLEVPGRYNSVGTNINYQLLNSDVQRLLQYCREKRLTSADRIQDIRSVLIQCDQTARTSQTFHAVESALLSPVFKHSQENTVNAACDETRLSAHKALWEMKAIQYPTISFSNNAFAPSMTPERFGTVKPTNPQQSPTITFPATSTKSCLTIEPTNAQEEEEQLRLAIIHSSISSDKCSANIPAIVSSPADNTTTDMTDFEISQLPYDNFPAEGKSAK